MPIHHRRLTDSDARTIPAPENGYVLHWCPKTPGFGLRITAAQEARAWISERRVDGKTKRRTLGAAAGRGAISADAARRLQIDVSSELQQGVDRLVVKRAARVAEKAEAVTFATALADYVKSKRRAKDGLPLKERTKTDYLAMIEPARSRENAPPTLAGELHQLADTPIHRIDAGAIRSLHKALAPRGERRQTYAMQVLRAVLRHHGVKIDGNPLDASTAGRDRVSLAPSRGKPTPIPSECLGRWWRAACAIETSSADMLRFALLTGCRPGELAALKVSDFDPAGARVTLADTKNRTDHTVYLSRQALEIATRAAEGKRKAQPLFGIADAGKTLQTINKAASAPALSQHKLRHTFASVAAELVPAFALRQMLNHAATGDVTAGHYVQTGEKALRAGWQAVADCIETAP